VDDLGPLRIERHVEPVYAKLILTRETGHAGSRGESE
jgi:hypothetical protein